MISFDGISPVYNFCVWHFKGDSEIIIDMPKGFNIETVLEESSIIKAIHCAATPHRAIITLGTGYDTCQVSERIALSLEKMGYKVSRKICDPLTRLNDAKDIQSFILG